MRGQGVATGVHFPVPLSLQPALAGQVQPCPVAERAADEVLSLPIDPLMTVEEVAHVVEVLGDSTRAGA
jgi:dTDP-4-amino-4,6-dideoxygalactose transaminase